ncbi:hypothetical protein [Paraburkholderia solisilvae]|uniref:Lipoprotein n=1 Tax=Paraburkholderia solisilvae TaxID=624376 RepID=A0A6J5EL57_9BURK|nr:hypothetical protein [Paraburkholderia solisilvae]CAB3766494.1 hypothetical protein LMG29739_04848 [Paraburkholderia solisilvae]
MKSAVKRDVKRLIATLIAGAVLATGLSGCIVVPYDGGGGYHHHDGYYYR